LISPRVAGVVPTVIRRRLRRPYWLGLFVLAACFPIRDFGCTWCEYELSEEAQQKIAADEARGRELLEPWIAARGEFLRVRDEALGVDWVAVEPGMTGLKPTGVTFPEEGDDAFAIYYRLDARRADRPDDGPRELRVAFTLTSGPGGPAPVAVSLHTVGPDRKTGGPTQDRAFHSCPVGEIHYRTFAAGESPCHHVPLVPLVRCGCDEPGDYQDPSRCAQYNLAPIPKKNCPPDEGEPVPP
jgi:hypothetical protein